MVAGRETSVERGIGMPGGFLPFRGSFMLDFVVLAMVAVVPVLAWSLLLARRGRYTWHRNIQTTLAAVLFVAVAVFEVDMRFITDWRALARPSPYYARGGVGWMLIVHLAFAIPTVLLWTGLLVAAYRHFPSPPRPAPHSRRHRKWGWAGAVGMFGTAVTGWLFYYVAFVA